MEDKKGGVRTDLLPSEFKARMDKVAPKGQKRMKKVKGFLGKFTEILSSLGLFPTLKTTNSLKTDKESSTLNSSSNSFKEEQQVDVPASTQFDPEKAYIKRKQEDAYLQSVGFSRDDLILTEEEYIKRKQEDAYFDSLPGYRKKDNERDER